MSHIRKQIRDQVTTLLTGLSTTGSRVYPFRVYPFENEELPGLCVYTPSETVMEDEGKIDQLQHREVMLVVDGYDKDATEDTLDAIADEVETALFMNHDFRALDLIETEITLEGDGEQPAGCISMTYKIKVLTNEGAPNIML